MQSKKLTIYCKESGLCPTRFWEVQFGDLPEYIRVQLVLTGLIEVTWSSGTGAGGVKRYSVVPFHT